MAGYDLIFNILFEPFGGWWLGIYALVGLVMIGAVWALGEAWKFRAPLTFVGCALIAMSGLWVWLEWSQYGELRQAFREGRVLAVEGRVHYSRRGAQGKGADEFTIQGQGFSIGPYVTEAYDRVAFDSGPNLEGECVRLYFVPNPRVGLDNAIVWLAIRRRGCAGEDVGATAPQQPSLQADPRPRR